jgi:hypothetical protein
MEPYTGRLAVHLVNKLSKGAKLPGLVEYLTGQSLSEFLASTLADTVPDIVLRRDDTSLATLTRQLGKDRAGEVCMEVLPLIFSHLLLAMPKELEEIIQWLTKRLATGETIDVSHVIQVCMVDLVTELLWELGDLRTSQQQKVR